MQRLFGACGRIVKVADFLVLAKIWRKKLLTDATFFSGVRTKKACRATSHFRDLPGARTQDPHIKSVMLYQLS